MLEEVEAVQLLKPMGTGRTRPLLLVCETSIGAQVEVVAKFTDGQQLTEAGLIREALAAMVAQDLGMPVPRPFLVRMSQAFISAVASSDP